MGYPFPSSLKSQQTNYLPHLYNCFLIFHKSLYNLQQYLNFLYLLFFIQSKKSVYLVDSPCARSNPFPITNIFILVIPYLLCFVCFALFYHLIMFNSMVCLYILVYIIYFVYQTKYSITHRTIVNL